MTVNGSGANAAPSGAKRLSSADAARMRKRMLVVDDEVRVLDVVREHFADRYEVDIAMSATDAVHIFEQGRPDVVFLDLQMPGVDGLALLTFLRRVHPEVPIIIVSANTSHRVAHDCVKVGAFGYVPKPRRAGAAGSAPGDG